MVFICPIKFFVDFDDTILLCNNVPNSPKYCKPLKLLHKSETKENSKSVYDELKNYIVNLQDLKQ